MEQGRARMNQKQANRLVKLMDYIENEVPEKNFDMNTYCDNTSETFRGCALGHATNCFKEWALDEEEYPVLYIGEGTIEFFGINLEEEEILFGTEKRTRCVWLKDAEKVLNSHGYDVI